MTNRAPQYLTDADVAPHGFALADLGLAQPPRDPEYLTDADVAQHGLTLADLGLAQPQEQK